MKIITRNEITQGDWQHLTQWKDRVFPEEGRGMQWSSVSWHTIAYNDSQEPVGHIGFDGFEVFADASPCLIIGIGGVVVRPEYQGVGIPALMFDEVHREATRYFPTDIFALFCPSRLATYYEKHGYQRHGGAVHFIQHDRKTRSQFEFMYRGALAPQRAVELKTPPW